MTIQENYDLTDRTTFHIPVKTRWFAEYDSLPDLRSILANTMFGKKPFLHIGGGSNLLFTTDFDGVILHSAMKGISIASEDDSSVCLEVESGVKWDDFVKYCVDHEYYGAENLAMIPGETGASAVQNIGAYGVEVKDIILNVTVYDTLKEEVTVFSCDDCRYGYRDSFFKHCAGRYIVLSVCYRLSKTPHFNLEYGPLKELSADSVTIRDVYDRICEIRSSKLPDPDIIGSAGSFFKNPVIDAAHFNRLKSSYPDIPHYPVGDMIKVPAGWLIENAGLKSLKEGKAQVYPKQCLVLVNNGGATADDVVRLYTRVHDTVMEKYGISLSPEVNII